jgi:chromosome segregation ATPase
MLAAQESHHAEDTPSPIAQEIEDSSDTESQDTTCIALLSEAPPDTLADARSAHTRLTQELAAQQQRITALRTREKAKDRECQQLQAALTAATQELAQQKTSFSELQATHDDLSNEYQRLFDIFKK